MSPGGHIALYDLRNALEIYYLNDSSATYVTQIPLGSKTRFSAQPVFVDDGSDSIICNFKDKVVGRWHCQTGEHLECISTQSGEYTIASLNTISFTREHRQSFRRSGMLEICL